MSDFDNDNGAGMVYQNYIVYIIRLNVRSLIINKNKKYRGDGEITEKKSPKIFNFYLNYKRSLLYNIRDTFSGVLY